MKQFIVIAAFALAAIAADQATLDRGQKEETQSCTPCHSLRMVHSQRLTKATWAKELDKMESWGTKFTDREALLEYLVATYGDDKPAAVPVMSRDGAPGGRKGQ